MSKALAETVFGEIDADHNEIISVDEFVIWNEKNKLE